MESFEVKPRRVIRVSLKKIIGLIVLGVILVASFNYFDGGYMYRHVSIDSESAQSAPAMSMEMPDMYRRGYEQSDISDTREFLKIRYSATLQTRDVPDIVRDVKGVIRDYQGRIDSENSSRKFGYVSFVVPKSMFESFRTEIESLTNEKLYLESINSENHLGEKQGIEERMGNATATQDSLETQKVELDTLHAQTVKSIQAQIAQAKLQLTHAQVDMAGIADEDELTKLQNAESPLLIQIQMLQLSLNRENAKYATKNQNLISSIGYAKDAIEKIVKQDDSFIDKVETVTGHINVGWISVWELAVVFSPIHPTIVLIVLGVLAFFAANRRGYIPKVEFV